MMRFADAINVGSSVIVAGVCVALGYSYFHRLNQPQPAQQPAMHVVDGWEEEAQAGIRYGPEDAPVVIVEFMDFECPYCAALLPTIDSIVTSFPSQVAVVFHHFPLQQHEAAVPAAMAAECAERQGTFWRMYDDLFAAQDSLGIKSWESFAISAAVPDSAAFAECMRLPVDSFPRIEYGRSLGRRMGVRGTPATWVNGQVVRPTVAMIAELLNAR